MKRSRRSRWPECALGGKIGLKVSATAEAGVVLAKASTGVKGAVEVSGQEERPDHNRAGLAQVVKGVRGSSDFVVLLDDFHYMPRDVQAESAKSLKEAVRLGVKVCVAAVRHRGDDLVRANA